MSAERDVTYVDASAIVKLAVSEPESKALRRARSRRRTLVTSALARTEVTRALRPLGPEAVLRGYEVLRWMQLLRVDDRVLSEAGRMQPAELRSLDAIHVATAQQLGASPASTSREARWPRRPRLGLRSETGWQRSPTAKSDGEPRLRSTSPPRNTTAGVVSSSIRTSSRSIGCSASWLARRLRCGREHLSADTTAWGADRASGLRALRDLRAARRRRYAEQVDWMESLYRLYLGVIFGGWGLALISGALADLRVNRHAVQEIQRHGAAGVGLLVAVTVAGGLRSGGRGGPLVLEAADVQHVLLAPIDRRAALRRLAVRRLRTAGFVGLVAGVIAANFAFRRLPGPTAQWLSFGGVFGAAVAIWALAAALIASGRRMHRTAAWLVGVLIVGWSVADLAGGRVSSPASMLGELALWPMHRASDSVALPAAGLGIAALAAVLGLAGLGGISLDAARRRAGLAAQLRFAVTTQDLRAIILLRRQLASELPRRRPWLRIAPSGGSRGAVWMRDWRSFLHWPLVRVARVCVLGAVAGLSLLGAWRGTTPLVLVASLAVMVAAFDAVEPIGQEVDHPTRLALLPVGAREVIRRHLLAPEVLMAGVLLIAVGAAIAAGAPADLVGVMVVMVLPTAVLSLYCAALSVTNDPFAYVLAPAIGYLQTGVPVALLIIGVSGPVILARTAVGHGTSAVAASVPSELVVLLICWGLNSWLGHRVSSRVTS